MHVDMQAIINIVPKTLLVTNYRACYFGEQITLHLPCVGNMLPTRILSIRCFILLELYFLHVYYEKFGASSADMVDIIIIIPAQCCLRMILKTSWQYVILLCAGITYTSHIIIFNLPPCTLMITCNIIGHYYYHVNISEPTY